MITRRDTVLRLPPRRAAQSRKWEQGGPDLLFLLGRGRPGRTFSCAQRRHFSTQLHHFLRQELLVELAGGCHCIIGALQCRWSGSAARCLPHTKLGPSRARPVLPESRRRPERERERESTTSSRSRQEQARRFAALLDPAPGPLHTKWSGRPLHCSPAGGCLAPLAARAAGPGQGQLPRCCRTGRSPRAPGQSTPSPPLQPSCLLSAPSNRVRGRNPRT